MRNILSEFAKNGTLLMAVLSWMAAQIIKVIAEFRRSKKIRPVLFFSSGGMPSSHTAFVMAMAVSVGLLEGFGGTLFAVSAVVSLVVMYDAAGVRRAAGNQAAAINKLIEHLENPDITLDKKLKELLGHSPLEVAAGALLGIIIAVFGYYFIF